MDSIDYYNRYAVPYYEETVDASMEEVMKPFVELLSEESENAEVLGPGMWFRKGHPVIGRIWILCNTDGWLGGDV